MDTNDVRKWSDDFRNSCGRCPDLLCLDACSGTFGNAGMHREHIGLVRIWPENRGLPAQRWCTSHTSTSTGVLGTRVKPIPQAASKAKATPASKGRAIVPTKAGSSSAANKRSKGPGSTAEKEKVLKDLLEKKKKAAQEAAEAKKKGECHRFKRLWLT